MGDVIPPVAPKSHPVDRKSMTTPYRVELNLDGLVGPTHHFAGLSHGNLASTHNAERVANPQAAALQGLGKMRMLHDLGFAQGILPPHERPSLTTLRALGFSGSNENMVRKCAKTAPDLLSAVSSAAAMWAANAATVSSSADTADRRVHFTPANLHSTFHRSLEAATTARLLQCIFPNPEYFVHHSSLPAHSDFGDEGAANCGRLCGRPEDGGITLFVFGRSVYNQCLEQPQRYPARQTREAAEANARAHGLNPMNTWFIQQNPLAIDHGAFHNDVVAVAHENIFLCHEQAFVGQKQVQAALTSQLALQDTRLHWLEIPAKNVSLDAAIRSYLFNSQLLTRTDGSMLMLVPEECTADKAVWTTLQELGSGISPINEIATVHLDQSMRNGGGPACLRLRIPLTTEEIAHVHSGILFTPELHHRLQEWVRNHYRDRLSKDDLADPQFLAEGQQALDELTRILQLGYIYEFQKI